MMSNKLFGIVGWKNSGKTTLVERLVSYYSLRGLTVSTIKHAHHSFDIDYEGTDSFRHRSAGAREVFLVSDNRWALIHEIKGKIKPDLDTISSKLLKVDIVLVEGFKECRHKKLEVIRSSEGSPIYKEDKNVVGIVTNLKDLRSDLPSFQLDDISSIANFIMSVMEIE